MTQEDKELLLKDLCARLPYGVMVREDTILYDDKNTTSYRVKKLSYVLIGKGFSRIKGFIHDYEYIYIPYLFPLSSMTEEQKKDLRRMDAFVNSFGQICFSTYDDYGHELMPTFEDAIRVENWLNANHFDYRGLIPKGLAIDATDKKIY